MSGAGSGFKWARGTVLSRVSFLGGKRMSETDGRNERVYKRYTFRVRRDSDLAKLLEQHAAEGSTYVNTFITETLCNQLGCKLPHRVYTRLERTRLI